MDTYKIKGEDHYQCREVKAERDALRAERDALKADAERWAAVKRMRWDDLRRLKEQPDHCDFTERFDAIAAIDAARGE